MIVTGTANIRHNTKVSDLKDMLKSVPDQATISVRTFTADRPGESSYSIITFTWDTDSVKSLPLPSPSWSAGPGVR